MGAGGNSMELIQKLIDVMPIVLPCVVAMNVILGGVSQLLEALKQKSAAGIVGKIAGMLQKLIDLIQGNIAHK